MHPTATDDHHRIYHLACRDEWQAAVDAGTAYERSTIGRSLDDEGFVHCSFAAQVRATADRHYHGRDDVVQLTIDSSALRADVRVESLGAGDERFPHVYGPIDLGAVTEARHIPLGQDGRLLVDELGD